jgi:hypothetical protein
MKKIFLVPALIFWLYSCKSGSADNKVPELADEMCDCFTTFQKRFDRESVDLLKLVSISADPKTVLQNGIKEMTPEKAEFFTRQIQSLGDKSSSVYTCLEGFDKKHGKETTKSKSELKNKLLTELQGKKDCFTSAAMVNLDIHHTSAK